MTNDGLAADDLRAMREYCDQALDNAVRWLADVARDEYVEVIWRPRPGTVLSEFKNILGKILPEARLAAWARETMMIRGDSIANLARFIASLLDDHAGSGPVSPVTSGLTAASGPLQLDRGRCITAPGGTRAR